MELLRALGVLSEPPEDGHEAVAQALGLPSAPSESEWAEVMLFQLVPYASVYVGAEGMIGGEARDRVAGFWRALGLAPPAEPDHLAALLGLFASLRDAEGAERGCARRLLRRESRRALLWEHLLAWLPPYLDELDGLAPATLRAWGALLRETLLAEAEELGVADVPLPLHLRAAPRLEPPGETGAEAFVGALLAPVRSGMILTRADLARAAEVLGLGLRLGERRLALRALLAQDARATLAWLASEALRSRERHARWAGALGRIRAFWTERAVAAAALLSELSEAAGAEEVTSARAS